MYAYDPELDRDLPPLKPWHKVAALILPILILAGLVRVRLAACL